MFYLPFQMQKKLEKEMAISFPDVKIPAWIHDQFLDTNIRWFYFRLYLQKKEQDSIWNSSTFYERMKDKYIHKALTDTIREPEPMVCTNGR